MSGTEQTTIFTVTGMDCPSCAASLERAVTQLAGVRECRVNFATEQLHVGGEFNAASVVERVRQAGFDVRSRSGEEGPTAPTNFLAYLWQSGETRFAMLGALLILPGLLLEELLGVHHPLINAASIGALAAAGWPVARSAWRALTISREVNINVLMTIAAIGALVIGAVTEAGMVMVLFAVGEALEGYTANRARHAIRSLLEVAPQRATRLRIDQQMSQISPIQDQTVDYEAIHVDALRVGDHILVKPGERIPMDGRVVAGASAVNQAAITGESRLIEKSASTDSDRALDNQVFAGSINGEGALEIEVTKLAADNTISQVIKMVEEAQERQAPAQRFVDRFAARYTPTVVVIAALVAVVPPLFFGQPFLNPNADTFGWLYRGLALLVVACPCALVISTPVSIISAISNAARNGVLIKGGAYLEALSQVRAVALDKTGTLTEGQPSVLSVRSVGCTTQGAPGLDDCPSCDEMIALAHAVEQRSEHPLARAILDESARRGVGGRYPVAGMVTALTGRGVAGEVNGRTVVIGSHAHFDSTVPHARDHCRAASLDAANGHTPMLVSAGGEYLGTITVADRLRLSSRGAIAQLRSLGLDAVVMLTGDSRGSAQTIGEEAGVTGVRAELLPADKLTAIEELHAQYGAVAMVGDGINDAPALAAADVGIAIGGVTGTTQAMETADITLLGDDLGRLPFAFRLARATMRTIRTNVAFSIGIKLAFLVLVLLGWGTMWMAVLADVGTSVLVTLNGMRLLRSA